MNITLLSAIISSGLSILTFVFASMTRALHKTPSIRTRIIFQIDMALYANDVSTIIHKFGFRSRVTSRLALALHISRSELEIPYMIPLADGCEIECIFEPTDATFQDPSKLEKFLNSKVKDGTLHRSLKAAFGLDGIPIKVEIVTPGFMESSVSTSTNLHGTIRHSQKQRTNVTDNDVDDDAIGRAPTFDERMMSVEIVGTQT